MFYSLSRQNLDTIFVLLCVIAGASSHAVPNTSLTPTDHDLINRFSTSSFIDFILDTSPSKLHQIIQILKEDSETQYILRHRSIEAQSHHSIRTICNYFSLSLNDNQMKFCRRHHDIISTILPSIMDFTRKQCARITSDLIWNCTGIDYLLDPSHPLGK